MQICISSRLNVALMQTECSTVPQCTTVEQSLVTTTCQYLSPFPAPWQSTTPTTTATTAAPATAGSSTLMQTHLSAPDKLVVLSSTTSLHSLQTADSAARCLGLALLHKHSNTPCGSCCCMRCFGASRGAASAMLNSLCLRPAQARLTTICGKKNAKSFLMMLVSRLVARLVCTAAADAG